MHVTFSRSARMPRPRKLWVLSCWDLQAKKRADIVVTYDPRTGRILLRLGPCKLTINVQTKEALKLHLDEAARELGW